MKNKTYSNADAGFRKTLENITMQQQMDSEHWGNMIRPGIIERGSR